MKAIVQRRYGASEVLQREDIPVPDVGPDDVLVLVHAAGVDAGAWHLMTGRPYLLRLFGFGLRKPTVTVRGRDLAGRVTAVGANVTRFAPGDDVFGTSLNGAFAEYTTTTEARLAPKPANLTFEQAAAVPVSACAALHGLRDAGRLRAGQSVLIIGAGGGVGSFAVQIAVAFGASVTAVCSTSKVDLVRSLGAAQVIDYTREDFASGTVRYDLILDIAGNNSLSRLRHALAERGTLVIVGGEGGGAWFGGIDRQIRAALLSGLTKQTMRMLLSAEHAEDLKVIGDLIESGAVTPAVDRTFPLDDAAAAIDYQHNAAARGKVVVTVAPSA